MHMIDRVAPAPVKMEEPGASTSGESEIRPSLLDTLRSPRPSDLARKRKIHTNPPPVGKKRSQAGTSAGRKHNPKTVTLSRRASEFPDEHLTASGGKLFGQLVLFCAKGVPGAAVVSCS